MRVITLMLTLLLLSSSAFAASSPVLPFKGGEGNAELVAIELFNALDGRMGRCGHWLNPCGLTADQLSTLQILLEWKGNCFPYLSLRSEANPETSLCEGTLVIDPTTLKDPTGRRRPRVEILSLLLQDILRSNCELSLEGKKIDWRDLAKRMMSLKSFMPLTSDKAVALRSSEDEGMDLRLLSRGHATDLTSPLRVGLGLNPKAKLKISQVTLVSRGQISLQMRVQQEDFAVHEVSIGLGDLSASHVPQANIISK